MARNVIKTYNYPKGDIAFNSDLSKINSEHIIIYLSAERLFYKKV